MGQTAFHEDQDGDGLPDRQRARGARAQALLLVRAEQGQPKGRPFGVVDERRPGLLWTFGILGRDGSFQAHLDRRLVREPACLDELRQHDLHRAAGGRRLQHHRAAGGIRVHRRELCSRYVDFHQGIRSAASRVQNKALLPYGRVLWWALLAGHCSSRGEEQQGRGKLQGLRGRQPFDGRSLHQLRHVFQVVQLRFVVKTQIRQVYAEWVLQVGYSTTGRRCHGCLREL
mmetsp:Transcript_178819/g.573092  ORF Transcript_178819/g.573092 Transcript_178819/m.573092 type:complete len:229 (+) Transcript_178819:356-1042(+)